MINFENQRYSSIKYAENLPKVEKVNNSKTIFKLFQVGLFLAIRYPKLSRPPGTCP